MQSRIVALYIPYLTTMLEHSIRFHKNFDPSNIDDSLLAVGNTSAVAPRNSTMSFSSSVLSQSSVSSNTTTKTPPVPPFDDDESKELIVCFLYILKNLRSGNLNLRIYIIIYMYMDMCISTYY